LINLWIGAVETTTTETKSAGPGSNRSAGVHNKTHPTGVTPWDEKNLRNFNKKTYFSKKCRCNLNFIPVEM
jgi:hypothetical protein